jgi:transcriptional regulator with XRE-family HTH domain
MDEHTREFLQLVDASGWSAAEVARKLGLNRSAVSQYRKAGTPQGNDTSEQTLNLFKRILAAEKPEVVGAAPRANTYPTGEESNAQRTLEVLHDALDTAQEAVDELNSKLAAVRKSLGESAVSKGRSESRVRRQKHSTDEPSE